MVIRQLRISWSAYASLSYGGHHGHARCIPGACLMKRRQALQVLGTTMLGWPLAAVGASARAGLYAHLSRSVSMLLQVAMSPTDCIRVVAPCSGTRCGVCRGPLDRALTNPTMLWFLLIGSTGARRINPASEGSITGGAGERHVQRADDSAGVSGYVSHYSGHCLPRVCLDAGEQSARPGRRRRPCRSSAGVARSCTRDAVRDDWEAQNQSTHLGFEPDGRLRPLTGSRLCGAAHAGLQHGRENHGDAGAGGSRGDQHDLAR